MLNSSQRLIPFRGALGNLDATSWMLPDGAIARLGRGRVRDVAFSPVGAFLAVATKIGLWWYELPTMEPVALWETERGMVSTVSFSHDGQWIATGNDDGITKVWDVQQGVSMAEMARQTHARQLGVSRLAFSPDNQCLAVTGIRDAIVDIWNPESGTARLQCYGDSQSESNFCGVIRPVAFSPNSRLLACLSPTEFISVWDINAAVCIATLTEHTGVVASLCFSPCGGFLAAGGRDGSVQVWETNTWKVHDTAPGYGALRTSVSYSEKGVLHATAVSDDTAIVWDVAREEKRWTYFEELGGLQHAHFSSDSQFVVAGAREWTMCGGETSPPHKFPHSHTVFPDSVVFSPDGKTLATGSWNDGVKLWDIATPSQQPTAFNLPGKNHYVSLSTCGNFLATGIDGNTVKVWDIGETTPRMTFTPTEKEDREVSYAAFSPIGHLLACGDSKGGLYLWDEQHQKKRHMLTAHKEWVHVVALSPDEKYLVSLAEERPDARLWHVKSGEAVGGFPNNVNAIAISPCSRLIACGMQKQILLWDVNCCEIILTLPHAQESWWPFALAFSPCGQYLASGATWQRGMGIKKVAIRLWDVTTGENIATFRGHPTDVQCLAFSPDCALLVSGSYDNTLLLWDMTPYLQTDECFQTTLTQT